MYKYLLKAPLATVKRVLQREYQGRASAVALEFNRLAELRRVNRIAAIRNFQHTRLWNELIGHLKYERTNARIGREYRGMNPSAERDIAFDAYLVVLDKLLAELEGFAQLKKDTPRQVAQKIKRDIPNNGTHWVDWVPKHVQQRVALLFDAIPDAPRMKRKIPFQRKIRPEKKTSGSVENKAKHKLLIRTEKELSSVNSDIFIMRKAGIRHDTYLAKKARIEQAMLWIRDLRPTDFVPTNWQGFYPDLKEILKEEKKRADEVGSR